MAYKYKKINFSRNFMHIELEIIIPFNNCTVSEFCKSLRNIRKLKSLPAAHNVTIFGKTANDVSGANVIAWQRDSW